MITSRTSRGIVAWGAVVALLVAALVAQVVPAQAASGVRAAAGWMPGWSQRLPVSVVNNNSVALTGHQVSITLPLGFDFAATKPYGEDIRVTDYDGVTALTFWLQNFNQANKTGTVWVKIPYLAAQSTRTVYVYTQNPDAWSVSNGAATFPFFTDFTTGAWQDVARMPMESADLTASMVGKKFYLFGGYLNTLAATNIHALNYSYDPYTNRYEQKSPMPTPRWGEIAAAVNGKIYVFAGQTTTGGTRVNEMYDPVTDRWTIKSPVPAELGYQGLTGCSDGSLVYLHYSRFFYSYNPATDTYKRLADLPLAVRSWATCATHANKVYILNGFNDGVGQSYTQIYDKATNTWKQGAPSPFGTYGSVRENPVIGDDIYLIQGQRVSGEFSSASYKYNIPTNTWTALSYGPHAADGVAGGVYGPYIYTFGGRQDLTAPYGLPFATAYQPGADRSQGWVQLSGNYEAGPSGLHRMVPLKGAQGGSAWFSQLTSTYRPSPPYIVEVNTNQTPSSSWNSLAVQTNGGLYNKDLAGIHAAYLDQGVSPSSVSMYAENGTQFSRWATSPLAYGQQQLRTYVVKDGVVVLRNGQEILRYLTPLSGSGGLSLQTSLGNTSTFRHIFVRHYAQFEVFAYPTSSMQVG